MGLLSIVFGKSGRNKLREALNHMRTYCKEHPSQMIDIFGHSCQHEVIKEKILHLLSQNGLNTNYLVMKDVRVRGNWIDDYKASVNVKNYDLYVLFNETVTAIRVAILEEERRRTL